MDCTLLLCEPVDKLLRWQTPNSGNDATTSFINISNIQNIVQYGAISAFPVEGWIRQANGQWTREHLISLSYDAPSPADGNEPDDGSVTPAFTASDYAQYDSFGKAVQTISGTNTRWLEVLAHLF